jgi:hypothetical protein
VAAPPSGFGDSDLRREDPLIFVSDASAEAERLTAALRARGYQVVDVPLTLLVGRVAVQRPALILCDVDAEGALETTHRLRDIPGGAGVDIIFIGEAGRTLEDMADAVFHEGSGFFVRPVDVFSLLHKAEALIGPPANTPAGGSIVPSGQRGPVRISSHPPGRRTPSQPPDGSEARPPSAPPSQRGAERPPSNPPGRIVASASRSPSSPPSKTPSAPPSRAPSSQQLPSLSPAARESAKLGLARQIPQAEISPELEQLLMRAEQRVGKVPMSAMSTAPLSFRLDPEAEVDAILPADVLAALDEPLEIDDEDDDESSASVGTRTGSEAGRTSSGTAASTAAGSTAIGGLPTTLGQRTASGTQGTGVPSGTQPPPPELDPAASAAAAPATSSGAEPMEVAQAAAVREVMESEPPPTPPAVPTRPPSAPSWLPPSSVAADAAGVALHPAALAATTPPARPPAQDEAARAAANAADGAIRRMTEPSTTPPRGRDVPPTEPPVASDELDPSSEPALEIPATLAALDAFRALAKAIRSRYTGALAFEEPAGIRRVVLRDGDFVTAASGADAESLAAFLAGRGDLAPEAARQARKLPQFGRHAGAALIAHGHLRQDDLWPVLRAHAEWILGRIANMNEGSASVERQIPPRLQAEPAVFGGATGAEVLVEIARRTIGPDQAIRKLGGVSAQFIAGNASRLLGECALPDAELALVDEAKTTRLSDLLSRTQTPEFASVLFALLELGVLAVAPGRRVDQKPAHVHDELDEEALRTRILTRKALVDDGDYFALLGVGRTATAYDIRRAYATLRREFEPSRVLGAKTADLRDDVDLILEVLEEAYEILKDERRRDRYRRALEANPSGRP